MKSNIEAVELIKRHVAAMHRCNRVSVVVAALSGFFMGILLMLLFPMVNSWFSTLSVSIPGIGMAEIEIGRQIVGWVIMGAVCVATAINAYEITVSKLVMQLDPPQTIK